MSTLLKVVAFLTLSFVALGSPTFAQDIRWKPELLMPGDFVIIDQSQTGRYRHVFKGWSGKGYVLESFRGANAEGTPSFVTYLNKDGNYLRWVRSDGFEIKYQPHDCKRTIGKCLYREVHTDGTRENRTRITKATRNGYSFQIFDGDGQFLTGGHADLDEVGFAGNGVMEGSWGKTVFRLIQTYYQ